MNNNYSQVFLTIQLEGSRLVRPGEFVSAIKDEKGNILKSGYYKTHSEEKCSTKETSLGKEFIEHSLNKPPNTMRISEKKWKNLSPIKRIRFHCEELVSDYRGIIITMVVS